VDSIDTGINRPTWTRGLVHIKGDKIILEGRSARRYTLFEEPKQHETLLMDLAELRLLGSIVYPQIVNKRVRNPSLIKDFARRHGLIWHQPRNDSDECQESWRRWLVAGYELSLTIALYARLREAITTGSAETLRALLRSTRDVGNANGSMPGNDQTLLEHVSVLLAERITEGLRGCSPTLLAACSLERSHGEKVGPPGDFRTSISPSNLLAVAYYELVSLIEAKAEFRECVGCGKYWRFDPAIHHKDRRYCEDACYERTRKREERARKRDAR